MQISARNQFNGIVKDIRNGAVNSEVTVSLPTGQEIVAAVTCESVSNLGLEKGKAVVVLIKAGSILIANNLDNIKLSARNQLSGIISHIERGSVNSIVDLDLGDGLALSAGITVKSSDLLNLVPGQKATAVFKAGAVILRVFFKSNQILMRTLQIAKFHTEVGSQQFRFQTAFLSFAGYRYPTERDSFNAFC